ncbi:MAG TPA: heparinase II/III family protein, partial [Acidobacteriaceae bacterium]|nr:heparinase II/III family protein [Acidobacteriaceae bacterium]
GGFSGWMSYPLAQDVGYDPSLYTVRQGEQTALFHKFDAYGQTQAWFGFVRPLTFSAGPAASIDLRYRLKAAGEFSDARLTLVGADGHKYTAALPSANSEHSAHITGAQLGLKSPAKIVAIILQGRLRNPPKGSESDWVLESFELHATRPKQVTLVTPKMDAAVDGASGTFVSREVVRAGAQLRVQLASDGPATIAVYDPAGSRVKDVPIPSGQKSAEVSLGSNPQPGLWRAEVTQGDAKTGFRFLVLGATPAHGHLLLPERRLDELSHAARYADVRRDIHERARSLAAKIDFSAEAGDNIEAMPSGPGIGPAYAGQLTPYLLMVEAYANAVAYNALDYRLNGNHDALDAAQRALLAMARWKTWSPERFRQHGMNTYYEVGCIAQRLAFGYDLIADQLSPQQRATVEESFWKQAIEPVVREYFLYNRNPIAASNWMANSVGGALAAAVATAGDSPEWNRREAPAIAELQFAFEEALHGLFPGDGGEAEPAGYENFAMQGISWGMSSLADLGIQPKGAQTMLDGFWWPYYATVKPGTQLDTGDFDGHLKGLSGLAWGAEHAGIPELRAFYEAGTHLDLTQDAPADQNGHHLEELLGPLDLACCSGPAKAFDAPPPSRIFAKRGSAVLRSGWGPDATVISLRVGPWFNHEHHDEGSFQVAAFGQTLVKEAGYAAYYTDPHYQDYFTQAAGHNTLLIDGDAFSQQAFHGRYWPGFQHPQFSASLLGAGFDYLNADLTSAYDGRLQSYTREYVFLKPDILIIHDRARSAEPHQFSWLLHTSGEAKVETSGADASIQLGDASASITAAGLNAAWKTATMPISILRFKTLDGALIEAPQELHLDSARGRSADFLVGMKLGLNQSSHEQLQPFTTAAGEGLRSADGKTAVVFRTGAGPLQLSAIKTDGSVLAKDGSGWMAVGATSVERDGHEVFHASTPVNVECKSAASGASLTLHTPAGASVEIASAAKPHSWSWMGRWSNLYIKMASWVSRQ